MIVVKRIISLSGEVLSGLAVFIIRLYKIFVSPLLPQSCRYYPTCSVYSMQAIKMHGFLKGGFLSLKRILSCNPLGKGGFDPVPENFQFRK